MSIDVKMSTSSSQSSRIQDDPGYNEAFEKTQKGLDKSGKLLNEAKERLKLAKKNLRSL